MSFNNDLTDPLGNAPGLDLFQYDPNDNAPVKQWTHNNTLNQRWKIAAAAAAPSPS